MQHCYTSCKKSLLLFTRLQLPYIYIYILIPSRERVSLEFFSSFLRRACEFHTASLNLAIILGTFVTYAFNMPKEDKQATERRVRRKISHYTCASCQPFLQTALIVTSDKEIQLMHRPRNVRRLHYSGTVI